MLAVLIYYKLFHYFTLSKMSLKQFLIASYGKELYKQTSLLQQMKKKMWLQRARWYFYNDAFIITSHQIPFD